MLSYDKTTNAESKFKTSNISKYINQEYLNIVENRDSNLGKEVDYINNVRKKLKS